MHSGVSVLEVRRTFVCGGGGREYVGGEWGIIMLNPLSASSSVMQQFLAPAVFLTLAPNVQQIAVFKHP